MMERPLCKNCKHRKMKSPQMNGNHNYSCPITHTYWRDLVLPLRACSLPEPYCYAPEMVKEIERLKAELATLIEQSKKDENEIQAREDYILKLKTELESALKPAREVAGENAELQETLDKSHKDVTKGDN